VDSVGYQEGTGGVQGGLVASPSQFASLFLFFTVWRCSCLESCAQRTAEGDGSHMLKLTGRGPALGVSSSFLRGFVCIIITTDSTSTVISAEAGCFELFLIFAGARLRHLGSDLFNAIFHSKSWCRRNCHALSLRRED